MLINRQWKKRLTQFLCEVLRKKGTERAFTGKYDKMYEKGTYHSAALIFMPEGQEPP
ncbi:MAG: hypothetical protein DRP57_07795 [Spirochaetes bacterium]|nr:MAG: hypothetical protein DRP57_07795 [Spirochaetota bacterium]